MGREPGILATDFVRRVEMISDAARVNQTMRKSCLAACILFRKQAGRMRARDQRIGRRLAQDPEVTNRSRPRSSGCVGWAARPAR